MLDPVTGMWLPVIVLSPVGFFLTYKAMHDSQLFNKEYYYRAIKRIRYGFRKPDGNLKTNELENITPGDIDNKI